MINDKIQIRNLMLSTRIVMPPMATGRSSKGYINDDLIQYYTDRAENPLVGMIITEHQYISPEGQASPTQVSIADDDVIEGLSRLTSAIHKAGVPVISQINHAGNAAKNEYTPLDVNTMSMDDIDRIEQKFVEAAVRAVKAGYDGVEIHCAHRYLLNQFYSPLTNHRTDEYGPQSVENRTRLQVRILHAVRNAIGEDTALLIRLGGCDYAEGGSTIEDAVQASVLFEQAGADVIDLSGGMCSYRNPFSSEPGYFRDLSSAVKKSVHIPVLLTGGITAADQAEELLKENAADLIGVGRALFKDAGWEKH